MQPRPTFPNLATLFLAGLLLAGTLAADPAGDRQLASLLRAATHLEGDLVELAADGQGFLGIHQPSGRAVARGGVILMHGPWNTLDGDRIIRPLRLGLAESGWETLSIQLPTAYATESAGAWQARHPALGARIAAASSWLAGRGQLNQVLLAEGDSAGALLRHVQAGTGNEIRGLILVSARIGAESPELEVLTTLKQPLLDITAERDHAAVLASRADRRRTAARNEQGDYAQREITGAVRGFPRLHQGLLAAVRGWLASRADGRQLKLR